MTEVKSCHFLVLGDGEMRQSYIDKYGNLPNLTFAPRVPKAQVHDFLTRCDLLYLSVHKSTVWDFGLSLNKLIDYMLAEKPILASYSGHQSMINEAGCGTFVPAADVPSLRDEFERYLSLDAAVRQQLGANGRQWLLENRRYEALAPRFLEILLDEVSNS
jgi:glycosyltransferase involved in cell wall biosynthesis